MTSINAMKLALAALETCRIRSVSEWSVEDITPKNVTAAIAALRTAIQQAEAQQPATTEPVYWEWRHLSTHPDTVDFGKWSEWKRVEARSAIHTIDDALAEFRAYIAQGYKYELRALYDHPAPSVPKDDQIAALVNKVRDIARMFHDHQSLRERIAIELVPALKASQEVKSNAERWRYAIADGGNQSMNFIDIFDDWDGDGSFVEAFDKARLADKKEGSAA